MEHGHTSENETIDALLESIKVGEGREAIEPADLPKIDTTPSETTGEVEGDSALNPLRKEVLQNVKLKVKVELGRTRMALRKALDLSPGSVIELGKEKEDLVEILVNSIPIARGQVLVVDDRFCVRIAEIVTTSGDGDCEDF